MTLKPLGDRVLVKPAPKEEKTSTGLYISSGAQEKPQRGEVIAVGAGKVSDKGERIVRTSRLATRSTTASSVATRSRLTARTTFCFAPTTSTPSSRANACGSSPAFM